MKTIGQILSEARVKRRYSLTRLAELTKIKKDFLKAIENEDWAALPAFPTVLGFVKSLSALLKIDANLAAALLKRDYPPKKVAINPRPDVSPKFAWSPKLTFAVGVGMILVLTAGYLGLQYKRFVSPPLLTVFAPKEGQVVTERFVAVEGKTDTDAQITVNNQPVIVDQDGRFKLELEVVPTTREILIKAVSRSGKETSIRRTIAVEAN